MKNSNDNDIGDHEGDSSILFLVVDEKVENDVFERKKIPYAKRSTERETRTLAWQQYSQGKSYGMTVITSQSLRVKQQSLSVSYACWQGLPPSPRQSSLALRAPCSWFRCFDGSSFEFLSNWSLQRIPVRGIYELRKNSELQARRQYPSGRKESQCEVYTSSTRKVGAASPPAASILKDVYSEYRINSWSCRTASPSRRFGLVRIFAKRQSALRLWRMMMSQISRPSIVTNNDVMSQRGHFDWLWQSTLM